jgi:serine/threonine-protein kinase
MAPEQMTAAKDVDTRVDVWALGVVLYELIAGHRPFNADTLPELIVNILHRPADPLGRPDVPQGLDLALRMCLEKSPANRFQNVAQLAAAIAPFGGPRAQGSVERIAHVLGVTEALPLSMAATLPASGPSPSAYPRSADEGRVAGPGVGTNGSWGGSLPGTAARPAPSKTIRVLGLALVVGVSLGVGGGIMWLKGRDAASASAAVGVPLPAPATATAPAASAADSATPWIPTEPAVTVASAVAVTVPASPPKAAVAVQPAPRPPPVAAAVRTAPPGPPAPFAPPRLPLPAPATPTPDTTKTGAAGCHIVSTVESDGTERFKKVCN